MFEDIEKIYITNNYVARKYAKIVIPIMFVLIIIMIISFMIHNVAFLYIASFCSLAIIFILKVIIYLKIVKPKRLIDFIFLKTKYESIVYTETKKLIKKALRKRNNYNINSINMLISYYKDFKTNKEFDIPIIINYIFSFLSASGVLLTIKNADTINIIYLIILSVATMIGIFYITNKVLDKLYKGVLDNKVDTDQIYKILTDIYLELVKTKNIKQKNKYKDNKIYNIGEN